ncbi:hypothetical protein IAE37_001774 [Pseudomonas sp. S31]|uniref:hypothetical protein n=1 Tax=Pseudomonas sp. S31 TaxID=1564473 RepID=UPI001913D971|nr:hypothetical protein [Pseudomonas sp. S31]MBK4999498.1 hypothetical protein [Pseudomonas sp. S31]
MPTENRSSNTELSKIVTEALVGMVSGVTGMKPPADEPLPGFIQAPIDRAVERIAGLVSRPAEQPQVEPIGEVVAFGKGLHEIAWSQGKMPSLGAKLYTHADPGEVERLREELAAQQRIHQRYSDAMCELGELLGIPEDDQCTPEVIEAARSMLAQLAERDALLRESSVFFQSIAHKLKGFHKDNPGKWCGYLDDALGSAAWQQDKIDTALSASAEPQVKP